MLTRSNTGGLRTVGIVLLAALGVGPALIRPPHTDEAGFLYLAGQVLDGMQHGVDFYDLNPPLVIWLSMPAVLIERGLGVPAWIAWIVMVTLAALACLFLVRYLSGQLGPSDHRNGFVFAAAFVLLLLPLQEFSEREHLALILVLPFALLSAVRARGTEVRRGFALGVGALGGVGFALKPHFLVTWLLLELWLLARLRVRSLKRPELWCLIGIGIVYLVLVLLLAPEFIAMALDLAPAYQAYLYNPPATVLLMAGPILLFLPGFALAARAASPQDDPVRDTLTLCLIGLLAAAVLQQKGLSYHFLGAQGAGFLLLVRVWQTRPGWLPWAPSGLIVRLGFLLILVIPLLKVSTLARQAMEPGGLRYGMDPDYPAVLAAVRPLAAGQPVLALSSNMNDGWPLTLDLGVRWSSRYMHFWPMAAVYHAEILVRPLGVVRPRPYAQRNGIELRFSDELMEDVRRHRPRVLLVVLPDSSRVVGGHARRFDYLGYFGSDPRFREILSEYRPAERIGIYQLLVRDAETTTALPPRHLAR